MSASAFQLNTKRTTGIPGDELMETTADDPMAMITGTGKYVVPIMHWRARNSKRVRYKGDTVVLIVFIMECY